MNKKSLTLVMIIIITGFIFLAGGILMAVDIAETITMNSKVYPKHTKSLVKFPHKKHAIDSKIGCNECHHVYKDGKNVWKQGDEVKKCDVCHSEAKKPKGLKVSKAERIKRFHYDAIHTACKNCHRDLKKEKKPTGPATCTGCHAK